jgi:hypothetical protein
MTSDIQAAIIKIFDFGLSFGINTRAPSYRSIADSPLEHALLVARTLSRYFIHGIGHSYRPGCWTGQAQSNFSDRRIFKGGRHCDSSAK